MTIGPHRERACHGHGATVLGVVGAALDLPAEALLDALACVESARSSARLPTTDEGDGCAGT